VSQSSSFAGITWGIFRKNIQNFEYFRKIKKCWKLSEKRTKPKFFENFRKNFQGDILQIFLVLCAFWTIYSVFSFFENFEIFQNSTTSCLAEPVSLGVFLMYSD
jgi:hypothetical protein